MPSCLSLYPLKIKDVLLSMFTELAYDEKIKYLAGEYYLSYSRIEAIIQPNFREEI